MSKKLIYLDSAAATPLDPGVVRVIAQTSRHFANPGSIHALGVLASQALTRARATVASVLAATPDEIIFTLSATAANNVAILGALERMARTALAGKGGPCHPACHIITTPIEHSSVLEPIKILERRGANVSYLPLDASGRVAPRDLARALRPETVLVSIGYANSETGVTQDLPALTRTVRRFSIKDHKANEAILFHTDAAQVPRFLPINVRSLGVDLLTLSGRKIYGPAQALLFIRRGVKLAPTIGGGGQERGLWPGTEDPAAAAGLARALELTDHHREKESRRLLSLRDYFVRRVLELVPRTKLNTPLESSLPNFANLSFLGADGEYVVLALDAAGVAAATGSACSQGTSRVIEHLAGAAAARSAVRFSLSRDTTRADLNYVLKILPSIIHRARFDRAA